jgi:hypothetical protein
MQVRRSATRSEQDKLDPLEVFFHNFIHKLGRMVKMIDNKVLLDNFEEVSNEYFKRLADGTLASDGGFKIDSTALNMMKIADLVLDYADIRGIKNLGVLKKNLERQFEQQRKEFYKGGRESNLAKGEAIESPEDDENYSYEYNYFVDDDYNGHDDNKSLKAPAKYMKTKALPRTWRMPSERGFRPLAEVQNIATNQQKV